MHHGGQPGVYLGRDMKNASNGPPATSPFKSTAIPPSPSAFSDQKLPARVTSTVSFQGERKRGSLSVFLLVNKAPGDRICCCGYEERGCNEEFVWSKIGLERSRNR